MLAESGERNQACKAQATVRACIPLLVAKSITIDVAAKVFERFGEVLVLDMQSCSSGGEVFVTFADPSAAERLLQIAEEIVQEFVSTADSHGDATRSSSLHRELAQPEGTVPEYFSLLAPAADEVPTPFSEEEQVKTTMNFIPEKVADGEDLRTSVVVSNLLPSCSSEEFLNAMKLRQLNTKLRFFYLPVDQLGRCVGYAFLDFEAPRYLLEFWRRLHDFPEGLGGSRFQPYISYTRLQGRSRLLEYFRGSDIMFCPDANKRPQFFFPDL